ncbi:hypothetical protein AMK59_4073 [Oryctes borbonicus]|uniref:2-(3-amino-3-carboxypropyl)histidine synthase subunit 1 n=1 Tax=Oryctes borbonicus TaxID=1629725 RepID=A0A0T6B9B4_9SCAR|nr:hypothetical protein AMK59_4073 [Oryctes borbonicus]
MEDNNVVVIKAKPVRKIVRATKSNKIPEAILQDRVLQHAIQELPSNYNFEIFKTIWRIQESKAKTVALQMPEGLLMYSTMICDIIRKFTAADTCIMGDVTYGACCIDDLTARALNVDLLVHYGHSCLIPMDIKTGLKVLYVFVDIKIDPLHFINTVQRNFTTDKKIYLVSTIQFVATLQAVASELQKLNYNISVPQYRPLSPGEILGCTAPTLEGMDIIIYLGDGRFHLEAAMIANSKFEAYRYDPYSKIFTREHYQHDKMKHIRYESICKARSAGKFGVIMGTLGRQGNAKVVDYIRNRLDCYQKDNVIILLSEIYPNKLDLFKGIEAFVQIACPRLSIDWGGSFKRPLLNPYEIAVALGDTEWCTEKQNTSYPMDFYANDSLGLWTPNHKLKSDCLNSGECCGKCIKENSLK